MSLQQRFCPLCDRAFQEGEAVLRCDGCSVMHHPGCWVTNGGCATEAEHRITPAAMAYASGELRPGSPGAHPAEGTRASALPEPVGVEAAEPIPFRPAHRPMEIGGPAEQPTVIGATAPPTQPMIHRTLPSTVGVPASPPRRYKPPPGEQMPRRQMPKIYDGHPIFQYWYVPAAILVAIFVAFSVIWVAGKLFGGDGEEQAGNPTPGVSAVAGAAETPTQAPTTLPGVTPTALPSTGPGKFKGGDAVLVTGTQGECLNVRVRPGRENDAIVCVKDGVELRITGGPETAGELIWWKVQTELGEGWAAEDYLVRKP